MKALVVRLMLCAFAAAWAWVALLGIWEPGILKLFMLIAAASFAHSAIFSPIRGLED